MMKFTNPEINKPLNTYRASGATGGIEGPAGTSDKLAITSTNIDVFSNDIRLGFIQSFNVSENRAVTKVQELGAEGVIQSVPGNTKAGSIQTARFAVYTNYLLKALVDDPEGKQPSYKVSKANPFKTLKHQRIPLEIKVKQKMPGTSSLGTYYIETYVDCWIASYSKTINVGTITISESVTLEYSDVTAEYVK